MNNRRTLLKTMALLPLAACAPELRNAAESGDQVRPPVPVGWTPPGGKLNLQKVKIKKVRAITTAP